MEHDKMSHDVLAVLGACTQRMTFYRDNPFLRAQMHDEICRAWYDLSMLLTWWRPDRHGATAHLLDILPSQPCRCTACLAQDWVRCTCVSILCAACLHCLVHCRCAAVRDLAEEAP